MSALSSAKIDKYKCFAGEEILLSNQCRTVEEAKFFIIFQEKFTKQIKTIKNRVQK